MIVLHPVFCTEKFREINCQKCGWKSLIHLPEWLVQAPLQIFLERCHCHILPGSRPILLILIDWRMQKKRMITFSSTINYFGFVPRTFCHYLLTCKFSWTFSVKTSLLLSCGKRKLMAVKFKINSIVSISLFVLYVRNELKFCCVKYNVLLYNVLFKLRL